MGEPGDGPLDEVYARISAWKPSSSFCVLDSQVAAVEQLGATVTGQGETRQVQREAQIILVVKYRTAAGRLTAWGPSFILHLLGTEGGNKAVATTGTANHPNNPGRLVRF